MGKMIGHFSPNGPSKGSQQGGGGAHQPVMFLGNPVICRMKIPEQTYPKNWVEKIIYTPEV